MCFFQWFVDMEGDQKIISYESLPENILLKIFMKLSLPDRLRAALTCRQWCNIFTSAAAWTTFHFRFYSRKDTRFLQCIVSYGSYLRHVVIELNQFQNVNRVNAVQALLLLAKCSSSRLSKLSIICTGENPLFYAGKEFVSALETVFGRSYSHLVQVNLSKFPMMIDSHTIDVLSKNNPQLESLNIQNDNLVCLVQPESILRLAQRCRRLRELCLHKCSLSRDVLLCFLEENRVALEHLSLQCRSEEIIASHPQDEKAQLSSELWSYVVGHLPKLRVTLHFDQTCPLVVIPLVMKPEVPCAVLRLETFTIIHEMVLQAAYNYSETLEKLILQAPPSAELESALLELSHRCSRLRALHVFCPLSVHTIDNILREHPHMKASGLYTLRSERGTDGPWATDEKVNA
ncbi:F-box/LRR-repeat protein 8 [Rhipicephalus microplus]|uniref:F-box/LRR-repeat protein 8 n=1 Tax=Rhipicephalus microplus TaxID=6941 RepID=UPI003F6D0289